ncbi:hypothetical protein RKD26_004778 [Streptomyces calvus]
MSAGDGAEVGARTDVVGRSRRGGDGAGVSARSDWRVRALHPSINPFRAGPRTDTPDPAPTHRPPVGATRAPTHPQLRRRHHTAAHPTITPPEAPAPATRS